MTKATLALDLRTIEIESEPGDNSVFTGQFSACGNYLAVIRRNQPVFAYDLEEERKIVLNSQDPARCLAFHPYLPELAAVVDGGATRTERFDLRCPAYKPAPFHTTGATCMTYAAEGEHLVVGATDGSLTVIDLDCNPLPKAIFNRRIVGGGIAAIAVKGDNLVGATDRGQAFKFDLAAREKKGLALPVNFPLPDWDCYVVATHPYLERNIFAGSGPYVRVLEGSGERLRMLGTNFSYIYQLKFMPELRQLAIVGDSGVEVWSTIDWQIIYRWKVPHGHVACTTQIGEELVIAWG